MSPFLRKVRMTSGAVAVQIVEKQGRVNRVLKHLDSAHDETKLVILLEVGREELHPGQLEFDFNSLGTGSRSTSKVQHQSLALLWAALRGAYQAVGFNWAVDNNVFEQLVLTRTMEPASKSNTIRILGELGVEVTHRNTFNNYLQRCVRRDYRSQLAETYFAHTSRSGDLSLVLYDVATLYFEAKCEDEDSEENQGLRKVGYSKERRIDPRIVIGLLVDRSGFPLEIGCFEGNKAETKTLLSVIKGFQDHHSLDSFVVVADASTLSSENLKAPDATEFKFIVGPRQTKTPHDLESHFYWNGDYFANNQIIDTVTPRHTNNKVDNKKLKIEPVWNPTMDTSWRAVQQCSARRARRDSVILEAQRRRVLGAVDGIEPAHQPRFVRTTCNGCNLDEKASERAQKLEGLKGYVTDLPAALMPATKVIDSYRGLWHMEQSFHMSKTDLRAHPIFRRQKDAIEVHLTIVMTALAVSRYLCQKTGITSKKLVRTLRPLREIIISLLGGQQITTQPGINPETQEILNRPGR